VNFSCIIYSEKFKYGHRRQVRRARTVLRRDPIIRPIPAEIPISTCRLLQQSLLPRKTRPDDPRPSRLLSGPKTRPPKPQRPLQRGLRPQPTKPPLISPEILRREPEAQAHRPGLLQPRKRVELLGQAGGGDSGL
jgi:hypothetical protein